MIICPPTFYSMSLFLSCYMGSILFGVHLPVMGFDKSNHGNGGKENPHYKRTNTFNCTKG